MDWIQTLEKAIDYMEENLLSDLECEEVAEGVYISNHHFQRTFTLLTGLTMGEYIRNRRLSLAGGELLRKETKVIDVALKYGYDSPESFTKAFKRFHGITPVQVKKQGASLKSFNRLIIKIIMEGGSSMDYRIEKKEAFEVVLMTRTFNYQNNMTDIPKFWSEYLESGLDEKVCGALGICLPMDDETKEFEYGIGCCKEFLSEVPEGFQVYTIPAYTWAIFRCVGPMPGAIQDMWKRVYSEWLPQANYELVQGYDIENYTEGDASSPDYVSEIWLPVKEK
ncbi:AraC family transcriptional regulator [Anaerocolumna chitinilytica]|uniref:AraC family transcriptional regulator n=1 Tax=Anaerocolumna chitinilytica TaxID=1727145 RepID=A0A7M3S9M6_9FIRM|nr:AraC family transcriptional regulator [Anaerocolumna chitinilytica]BCK01294.1 AraC family transcriptional regulator [Anaerocolumna chitinilytica]